MNKKEEIIKVIKNNPTLSGINIFNKIKGTKLGIRQIKFLKIYRKTKNIKKQKKAVSSKWTKKEIDLLCKYYSTMKTPLLKKWIIKNRSIRAIDAKANKLELKKVY